MLRDNVCSAMETMQELLNIDTACSAHMYLPDVSLQHTSLLKTPLEPQSFQLDRLVTTV